MTAIERAAVIGAGNMGHGIAEVIALGGYEVTLQDVDLDALTEGYEQIEWSIEKLHEKGQLDEAPEQILARIDTHSDLETAVSDVDIVIEAAPEKMAVKRDVFATADEHAPDNAFLASNTSSLSISEIAETTSRQERVTGTHFFNPPVKMDLVEIIYGDETSDDTAETVYSFLESLDKTPIYVRKDVSGFIVNNVLSPFIMEPSWMVSNDDTTVQQADAAMVHQAGYPMGPFEFLDMTGIDIQYDLRTEGGQPIPPIIEEKAEANQLGMKTGEGFYSYGDGPDYEAGDGEGFDTFRIEARMINEAAKLIGDGVATADEIDTGVRLGAGFPEGICYRADKIGLDEVLDKLRSLHEDYGEARYEPADYLVELVEAGNTGVDAGEGFFVHDDGNDGRDYRFINTNVTDDGVLEIEIDRAERMNSLTLDIIEELDHVFSSVDPENVHCVTIEGAGDRAFCAGADISVFSGMEPADALNLIGMYDAIYEFPRPTIAKIDGLCLGGGLELALACDLRVATNDSVFGQPEIKLGLIPGSGGTQRLTRLIGETRTKELVFRGNRISADRAEEWGILNQAVPDGELDDTVGNIVDDMVAGPPVGLRVAKQVINDGQDASLDTALSMEGQGFSLLMSTQDAREGTAAFREDREPQFEGK